MTDSDNNDERIFNLVIQRRRLIETAGSNAYRDSRGIPDELMDEIGEATQAIIDTPASSWAALNAKIEVIRDDIHRDVVIVNERGVKGTKKGRHAHAYRPSSQ